MAVGAVSLNTFRETIRNRVLVNILVFAIGMIFLGLAVSDWSMGHQIKVIKDFGLGAMSLFGLLIAVFIGIRLVVQEVEGRTIYIVASKPIHRWNIVTGKFLGLSLTLLLNMVLMSVALFIADYIMESSVDLNLIPAIILIYIEVLLVISFALFFSSFTSPTLSALFTIIIFIVGHLSSFLRDYVEIYPDKGFHWLYKLVYYIVPDLEKLNFKMSAVEHIQSGHVTFVMAFCYGVFYILLIHFFTALIFQKRDLK